MSQHVNSLSALLDHCKSVAWLISNGPNSISYCYKLGPKQVKAKCLCTQKATTIFQHTNATADCTRPHSSITKDMRTFVPLARMVSSFLPWLGFIVWALPAMQQLGPIQHDFPSLNSSFHQ